MTSERINPVRLALFHCFESVTMIQIAPETGNTHKSESVRKSNARALTVEMTGASTGGAWAVFSFSIRGMLSREAILETRSNLRLVQIPADEHHLADSSLVRFPKSIRQ